MNRFIARSLRLIGVASLVFANGCSVPVALSLVTVVPTQSSGFDCAWAELNRLGYAVREGNRDVGYVTVEKRTSGAAREVWTNEIELDVITATTFVDAGKPSLRIVGKTIAQDVEGSSAGNRVDIDTSETVSGDARRILDACGTAQAAQ